MQGLLGKKIGMTQVYDEQGAQVPVTVVLVEPTSVVSLRTPDKNGYEAVQLSTGRVKVKNMDKSVLGQFKKGGVTPASRIYETKNLGEPVNINDSVSVAVFEGVKKVTVTGTSIGRGFAGTIKRHGFARGPATHGSKNVREPGSVGAHSFPARVFPGKRLPGHYGNARVTVKNLKLVKVDTEKSLLFIKGAVPGPKNGSVFIKKN